MNNIPDSERMLLDFDGWLGTQPEDRQAQLRDYIDTNPDPVGAKRGIAARFAVAESTGIDPVEVDDKWDIVRGGFAAQKGGDWLSTVNDENAFHSRLVQEAQFRRDERQLIFGPDDEKAPDATDKRSLSLVKQVEDAAFSGGAFADTFAQWQGAAVVNKGWRADRHPAHETVAREVYDRTAATVAKVKPIAEEAFAKLAAYRENGGGDIAPFGLLRGLSSDEKAAAFRLMSQGADGKPDKTRIEAFGEAIGRGFENLAFGLNGELRHALATKRFVAGEKVTGSSALEAVKGKDTDQTRAMRAAAGGMIAGLSDPSRVLSEEEAQKWNAELDAARDDLETMESLRKFGMEVIDPTNKTGGFLFQKMVLPVADSTAIIAGLANPGTAYTTLVAAAGQYSNDEYARLRNLGMDPKEASGIANVSGVAQAALDKLGFEFLRGVPAVNNVLNKIALGGGAATRFAINAGTTLAAETAIELTQDQIIPALMQDLYSSNPAFDVNWSDVWRDAAKAAPETALGMVLLSSAGGAFQTFTDSQHTRMLSQSKAAMTLAGYSDAQIDLIQQQPIAERGRLLAQFAPDKAPTGAEKDALIERYAKAEKAERAEYVEKLKAEAGDASDALDYAVRVTRRQGSGWTVTTESGKNLVVDSAEAARRIRQDLAQASSQREAETLVAMVEDWHNADADAQRQTTFTGETATSDGTSITYKRDGKITREITDEKTLETLRREAEIVASQTGSEAVNVIVNGSNQTFRMRVADAASQVVQRLEINRSASSVLTFLHESMESNWRAGMQDGTLTRESTRKAVASIAGAFNINSTDAETRAFAERVQRVADGKATDDELRETVSELAVADVIGRRKDGGKVEVGSVSRAISDAIQRAADESAIAGLSKLQAFIRAAKTFFRGVLGTVAAIRKAKQKDGKLAADWESFMHKLTGTSAQTQYDAGRVEDLNAQLAAANAASADYVPPTAEQEAAGIAFSASRATPSDSSNVIVAKDGTVLVGPTTFSISAYHGTPHKVDKFSTEKIGTGEGAQAYGWGLYFAESKAVAEDYKKRLTDWNAAGDYTWNGKSYASDDFKSPERHAIAAIYHNGIPAAKKLAKEMLKDAKNGEPYTKDQGGLPYYERVLEVVNSVKSKKEITFDQGKLYTVELDVEPDELLDWDKPLSEQSEKVQSIIADFGDTPGDIQRAIDLLTPRLELQDRRAGLAQKQIDQLKAKMMTATARSGAEFYNRMGDAREASARLAKAGIPGIRYLDGNSRDGGKGTSNFVIFDESKIKITAENGKAVAFSGASKTAFSVSRASDAEYLDAVKRGDMATAQRMVDEAARAAGYNSPIVYHGTQAKFNVFDESKIGSANGRSEGSGFYFTTDKSIAEGYQRNGGNVVSAYLKIRKALDYNAKPFTALQVRKLLKSVALTEANDSFDGNWKDGFLANYGDTYSKGIDSVVNEAASYFKDEQSALDQIGGIIGSGVDPATVNEALNASLGYDAFFSKGFSGEGNRGGDIYVATRSEQVKSADAVTYDDAGNVVPLSQRFNEASNDIRFSISPSAHVELLQRQVDTQLKRDPERRRKLAKAAGDKLQALQFAWETDRVNERGVKTRALVEQRSPASLSKEQAFREAARREELEAEVYAVYGDVLENESLGQLWGAGPVMEYLSNPTDRLHGRLMSKSQALKSGKFSESNGDYDGIDGIPRVVFGGSLMPDQVAQELFEAGILKDASVDALWDTIRDEIKSAARWKGFIKTAKEKLKKAKRQAHEEAAEWRREQDELQKEDWNPKARLLRDMRALDAVISVLPPELRSKVGGFIKLAELTTDKARMKEIERRMKKLGGIVEEHLKKESIEAIDALIERAQPSTGPGEKPKGKITVEGHRVFAAVEAVRGLTAEQVDAERARLATEIEKRITKGEDVIDLLEQEQILEMFGAIDEKTAAEADSAASWLDKVYRTGRNAWRMMEEARLAEVADLKEQTIAAIGAASKSGTQEQKKNAAKLKAFAESASFQLLSFTQVLESVVGAGHPLVARWSRAAREATNQRTDAILGANARFEKAARDAFGGVSKLEMSRRLWAMSNDQRISLPVVEGGRSETLTVPIEKIRQFADGSVNPADLGYSPEEAADLIDQLNALPAKSRKKNLSVERILPGETRPAQYTEAEVMALTMLAKQEQYLPNLEKHGYTAAVIEAAESSLSDAAKAIRTHLLKEYADGYAPLAKVFREMFGIDLPSVANYSPAAFMHAGETRDVDPFGGMVAEGGFRAGFLKSRKEHLAAPRIENALQTFQGHVAQTEHWRAFAPLVRELRAVFGSVEVKDSILSNRGIGLANAAQSWISALEMNGLQQRAFMSALNPIFRYLTGKQATLTLAWKAGTLIKQSLATLSSAARLPSGVWLRGLSRVLSGKIDVSAIRNSPMIQRRIESGFSPEVRAAMVSLFNGKPSAWSQFVQSGMEKIGEVDAFFTSIGTAIAYDYHFNEGLKNGMSEAAAREMALVEAEDNLGRTAQPTELIDRSLYELGMSPAERVSFMFASNARKDAGLLISAFQQFKAGKISKAEFTQTVAIAWLAVSFGNAILSAWWRDANDDDDEAWLDWEHWSPVDIARNTLLNPVGGLPLVGALYNTFIGFGPNDPFKPVKQMKSAVAGITDGDKSEPVEKTVRRVVDVLNGAAVFVPKLEGAAVGANIVEQAFNLADNLVPDTESEATKKEKAAIAKERRAAKAE